nr:hypothetical protein [uncultured Halomonas sp.]
MENSHIQYESLLSWINPQSQLQTAWIVNYLSKKGQSNLLSQFNLLIGGGEELVTLFRGNLDDIYFRELIRSMRGAWYQKIYRESNGKQVSFQLPASIINELSKIAKDRNQSKTQTLRQVIHDAAKQNQRERIKSRDKTRKLEKNLKNLKDEKLESESLRNRIINTLSERLVEEIILRCSHEKNLNMMGYEKSEAYKGCQYQELTKKIIDEIDKSIPEMRMLKPGVKPIKSFLPLSQIKINM